MARQKILWRKNLLIVCALGALIGFVGLWPHLSFSYESGEFLYFHGAYDEDTYTLGWLRKTLRSTRYLSGYVFYIIYGISNLSINMALVLSDFILPFLVISAAYFAVSQIYSSFIGRVLTTVLLVFANDFFSLGNLTMWSPDIFSILRFSNSLSIVGENLVPSYETTFLGIYRTPEPQVSYLLMFVIFGLLIRFAKGQGEKNILQIAALIIGLSLLPFGYTFVTLPTGIIAFSCAVAFAALGRWTAARTIAIGLLAAGGIILSISVWQQAGSQSTADLSSALSYHTHRPIITPSVITSFFIGGAFSFWILLRKNRNPLAFLAAACLLLPFCLSNQQVITGIMISARDWERNFHCISLMFGLLTALVVLYPSWADHWPKMVSVPLGLVCGFLAFIVLHGQSRAIGFWMAGNTESLAIARALASIDSKIVAESSVTLEKASLGPLVQMRRGGQANILLDFYQLGIKLVPNMMPAASTADPSPYEDMVFEYWFRTGASSQKAEEMLRSEIKQRAGLYSNYLFSFRDAWYPASDNRAVRSVELERSVEPIIARYETYIRSGKAMNSSNQHSLFVTSRNPQEILPNPWLKNEYVGQGSAGEIKIYVYAQRPQ